MGIISKTTKSRRRRSSSGDKSIAVGLKDIQFIHQFSGGETTFNLKDLTLPAGTGSFQNPLPQVIANLSLMDHAENFELFLGTKRLIPGISYEIFGTLISLNFEAGEDEIVYGKIRNVPRNGGEFLDGEVYTATGFLTPGETDFSIGFAVNINDSANDRMGPVRVHRQREIQYLNTERTVTGPSEDGDYGFVEASGSGQSTVIRFNNEGILLPGGLPEFISVESRTIFIDRNNNTIRGELQAQQGIITRINDVFSSILGIDPNDQLVPNPTTIQLQQFGDNVLNNIARLTALENYQEEMAMFTATETVVTSTDQLFNPLTYSKDTKGGGVSGAGVGRYTFQRTGSFIILLRGVFQNNSSAFRALNYRINNGSQVRPLSTSGISSTTTTHSAIAFVNVSSGDYIDFIARQSTGSNETVDLHGVIMEKGNVPLL